MKQKLRVSAFLLSLVLFFTLFDFVVSYCGENLWSIPYNDYEVTRTNHPEETWDKVFFGNSSVISAYREDTSTADYVNLGMDYAVVTDLWKLLKQGHIQVGSELVIGLNLFTLYDDFDTNPAYIWHRRPLEPYSYFHRDKLMRIMKDSVSLLQGQNVSGQKKILYYGCLSDAELQEKMAGYQEKYFCLPTDDFQENIRALESIADWCQAHDVRLRILWMPYNPSVEQPQLMQTLQAQVNDLCNARQIPVGDFTNALDETCFHDVGHLNYEHGSYIFTEEVDQWLLN